MKTNKINKLSVYKKSAFVIQNVVYYFIWRLHRNFNVAVYWFLYPIIVIFLKNNKEKIIAHRKKHRQMLADPHEGAVGYFCSTAYFGVFFLYSTGFLYVFSFFLGVTYLEVWMYFVTSSIVSFFIVYLSSFKGGRYIVYFSELCKLRQPKLFFIHIIGLVVSLGSVVIFLLGLHLQYSK